MHKALVLVLTQDTKKGMVPDNAGGEFTACQIYILPWFCILIALLFKMTAYKCCKWPSSDILSFQTETSASLPLTCLGRAGTGTCGSTTTETARYAPPHLRHPWHVHLAGHHLRGGLQRPVEDGGGQGRVGHAAPGELLPQTIAIGRLGVTFSGKCTKWLCNSFSVK